MRKNGFSFIELLISLGLFSFILISTAQLLIYSLFLKRHAERTIHITEFASEKLEYFKSLPYESPQLQEGNGSDSLGDGIQKEKYKREWKIQEISPDLKIIELEVYPEAKPQKKFKISLLISKNLGF